MPYSSRMTKLIHSVCVYCGTANNIPDQYKSAIKGLGRQLAQMKKTVVYGGGSVGTMGMLAEAALDAGGDVVGIIPEHIIKREGMEHELTELHVVDSMHSRKMMMVEKSDAFVTMPGGLGTLDETFEVLTWKYLGLHDKPVILGNIDGYWDHAVELIENMNRVGYTPDHHLEMFDVANSAEEIIEYINSYDIEKQKRVETEKM